MKSIDDKTLALFMETGKSLAQIVASSSFEFWQRKDFRLYVDFNNLPQSEQDRMFNELEVSVIGLFTLTLDYASKTSQKKIKKLFSSLRKELVASFLDLFTEVGIEKKFVNQWEELIDMRLKEYRHDFKTAYIESGRDKSLVDDEEIRSTWARVETITIDCLSHIRRGEIEEEDPLWKLLRKWFIALQASVNPVIELGQKESRSS
jgi:hypothetical protein